MKKNYIKILSVLLLSSAIIKANPLPPDFKNRSPLAAPTTAPNTPVQPQAEVISLFSNAYTNVPVSSWAGGTAGDIYTDETIAGNTVKKYTSPGGYLYSNIEITTPIDATAMEYLHLDFWKSEAGAFGITITDFGADGVLYGGDDVSSQLYITELVDGWRSCEIKLSAFTSLTNKAHIGQILIEGATAATVPLYIDNLYFHKLLAAPGLAAPVPANPSANVISLYSNAYTNVPVDEFVASWTVGTVTDIIIAGNSTKKYADFNYSGILFSGNIINAAAAQFLHVDLYSPNTNPITITLKDLGADGASGGGDDVSGTIIKTPAANGWVSYNIPLGDFTGLTTKAHLYEIDIVGDANTAWSSTIFYLDNLYFYAAGPLPGPLPVELVSFTGDMSGKQALLKWLTASEINSKGFGVQRSADGINFTEIGFINGSGNSDVAHTYNFTDSKPLSGSNYYRLKQVDNDGRFKFSNIVQLNFKAGLNNLSISPNPASNFITLPINNIIAGTKYDIITAEGKVVDASTIKSKTVSISRLASGNYFLRYYHGNDISTFKFIIVK